MRCSLGEDDAFLAVDRAHAPVVIGRAVPLADLAHAPRERELTANGAHATVAPSRRRVGRTGMDGERDGVGRRVPRRQLRDQAVGRLTEPTRGEFTLESGDNVGKHVDDRVCVKVSVTTGWAGGWAGGRMGVHKAYGLAPRRGCSLYACCCRMDALVAQYKSNPFELPVRQSLYSDLHRAVMNLWTHTHNVPGKNKAADALARTLEETAFVKVGVEQGTGRPVHALNLLRMTDPVHAARRDAEIRRVLLPKLKALQASLPANTFLRPRDPVAKAEAQATYAQLVSAFGTALAAVDEELKENDVGWTATDARARIEDEAYALAHGQQ